MRREVGSIVEVTPGIFRVSVSVGHSSTTGKRRRPAKIVRGTGRDAEMALARLLLEAGKLPETEVTVRQFLEEMYLPHVEGRRRIRTVDGYRSIITRHVLPELGDTALVDLTPYQLSKWMDGLTKANEDPLEDATRLHVYRCLFSALKLAVVWGLAEDNPLRAVESPPPARRKRKDVLTVKEAGQYLEAFRGHALEPLLILALACGLRRSELAGLVWSDLDFDAGTVTVRRGLHDRKGGVIVEEPKSIESLRTIAVPQWALGALKPLRALGPLVVEDGEAMAPWRISQEYGRKVSEAKLRKVQLKNLRHTHAVLMLDAGVDLYTVSRRLGHSTTAVTEAHYVDPTERADRAAADALKDLRKPEPSGAKSHPEPF